MKLGVASFASLTLLSCVPGRVEAREIVSCFYPNGKCEGEDGDYGVSCTYTEANECPTSESDGAMHLDECVQMTRGGSRMVTCPGPWWPWIAYFLCLGLIITAIVRYWRHVQAGARMEEYLDSLPWYDSAKPAIHSAEVKIVDAGQWLAKNAVSAEHYIAKKYHADKGKQKAAAPPVPPVAGAEAEPEPEPETQPLTAPAPSLPPVAGAEAEPELEPETQPLTAPAAAPAQAEAPAVAEGVPPS
jgi:hypothetical protein